MGLQGHALSFTALEEKYEVVIVVYNSIFLTYVVS